MNLRRWLIALLTSVIFILVKGYSFNNGDQEEHLPQVYQLINPVLYPKDYFVTAYHQTFTVRFFFVWLIYLFHFLIPVSLTCFLFQLLCITIVSWCIQMITLHFNASELFAAAGGFFLLVIFNSFTIGGNALMDTQLTCSVFAIAFCALAFYYAIKKQWHTAGILSGLAAFFQVLAGLQMMLLLTIIYLVVEKKRNKIISLVKVISLFLIFSSPMLFPILCVQMQWRDTAQNQLFYDILYRVRNPNHYLPSVFPFYEYARFFILTFTACLLHSFVGKELKQLWRILFFVVLTGMASYFLLLEGLHFMPIGKLQWFKISEWLTLMNLVVIIVFASDYFNKKYQRHHPFKISHSIIIFSIVTGLIIITNSAYLPFEKLKQRYQIGNYPKTDLYRMNEWISKNTAVDCLILTAPDNTSFLCQAQRNMPIGWKAIIHEPFFLIPWYNKFNLAYHNGAPFYGFNVLEQATYHYSESPPHPSEKLKWDYRLINLEQKNKRAQNEIIVHRERNWVLLK